jgi:hypothetical protein
MPKLLKYSAAEARRLMLTNIIYPISESIQNEAIHCPGFDLHPRHCGQGFAL